MKKIVPYLLILTVITLLLNCEEEEIPKEEILKKAKIETVSIEKAKDIFLRYQKRKKKDASSQTKTDDNELSLTPQWETTAQDSLSFTEALLTNAETLVNREGNYTSKLFFLEVNDSIMNGIQTVYIDDNFEDGTIKNARVYFNDFEGHFLDAYKITNGEVSHRLVPKQQTQQAGFLAFMFFFQSDCWNTDNLPEELDEIVVHATISSDEDAGGSAGSSGSDSATNDTYWYYTANSDENNDEGTYGGAGNSNTNSNSDCPAGKVFVSATNQCECPDGKIEDSSGNCIDECTGGKILDVTDNCVCPEGKKENSRGECIDKTPCDNIKDQINNIAFRMKVDELKGKTNLKKESGYSQNKDGTFNALSVSSNGHSLTIPTTTNMVGYMHTHVNNFLNGKVDKEGNPEETQPIRMFSPADVKRFLELILNANTNNIPISDVYGTMVSSSGTYTLRFTGNIADVNANFSPYSLKEKYKSVIKKFGRERGFLKFIKHEIGIDNISLYKIKNNGTIKRKFLKNSETLDSETCE